MKSDKGKKQKKVLHKKSVAKVEESLRGKLFDLIEGLGHDVVDVSDEVYEMSKRLAKKLSKKVTNVFSKADLKDSKEKIKKVKVLADSLESKGDKSKKKAKKNSPQDLKTTPYSTALPKLKEKDQPKVDKKKKSRISSEKSVINSSRSASKESKSSIIGDGTKNEDLSKNLEDSVIKSSQNLAKKVSEEVKKVNSVAVKSDISSNEKLAKKLPLLNAKKPIASISTTSQSKLLTKPAQSVSKVPAAKTAVPAKSKKAKVPTTSVRVRSANAVKDEEAK